MPTDPLLTPFCVTGVFFTKYTNITETFYADPEVAAKGRYYLKPTLVSGLGIPTPNIRTSEVYRMHGAYFVGMNIPSRTVTLVLPVVGDIQAWRTELFELFAQDPSIAGYAYYDMNLELTNNTILVLHKVVLSAITEELKSPRGQFLTLTFFAADPWWYDTRLYSDTQSKTYEGPPYTLIDKSYTIQCLGSAITYPVISISGEAYLITIENTDTDQLIGPIYWHSEPDELIWIQTPPYTERGVFSSIYGSILQHVGLDTEAANIEFWLDPGFDPNHIEIAGRCYSGTVSITLEWHAAYVGV